MTKPYPSFICRPCGQRYGKRKIPGEATWNVLPCDICGSVDLCTQPRDFGHLIDGWQYCGTAKDWTAQDELDRSKHRSDIL